ncbi:MAG: type VI secretion system tip protein TssI/VgrG [Minicystis sp.]
MAELILAFESDEDSLSVRRFSVSEEVSCLFSVSVWARSPDDDLDLEAIVGHRASFRLVSAVRFGHIEARSFTGVCSYMEQQQAESTGLSSYYLRIVPRLWLLTQRSNHRLFQHLSIPDIAAKILGEWRIEHELRLRRDDHPALELRVQYGESDFDFLSRLLEEAGISYLFRDDEERGSVVVLTDAPETAERRSGGPIPYVDNPTSAFEREHLHTARVSQQVRPGKVTLRDFDFRRNPAFPLYAHKGAGHPLEDALEQYRYAPNAFLVEVDRGAMERTSQAARAAELETVEASVERRMGEAAARSAKKLLGEAVGQAIGDLAGKLAGELLGRLASSLGIVEAVSGLSGDDRGMARSSERAGFSRAQKQLESARTGRRVVTFETNLLDLAPGTVIVMGGHPRKDLGPDRPLLVTSLSIEGTHDGSWVTSVAAAFADLPYRPAMKTARPIVQGLQSAVVTGPAGQEIHTDEGGRVRVQFHWDREGQRDDQSSCWMRVSQGWAGSSYGMITLPRVGHEVLVAFLEGDPDHPVIVGRLYNSTARPPYPLPENKTRSGWRSASSPGSGGYNEIMFEDALGAELVNVQAERDLEKLVKRDESIVVGRERRANVGTVDVTHANERHTVTVGKNSGLTFSEITDKRIHLSTGGASITLDGDEIRLEAKGRILLHSTGNDVELLGGPWVKINCGPDDNHVDHELTLVDPFGNPMVISPMQGELSIDGEVTEHHEAFTSRVIRLAPGQVASVKLTLGDSEGEGEES